MTKSLSRRFFLTSAAGFFATAAPVLANVPDRSLRPVTRSENFFKRAIPPAEALVSKANLGGAVAFSVADAQSGLVLEDRSATLGLPPASVAKAITAAYALDTLGGTHRFVTRVYATGPTSGGIVQGDLILAGGGDPTLDTDALAGMVGQLRKSGIKGITGRFKVWDGAVPYLREIDPSQPAHLGYNPSISGLSLNFNRVHFEWRRVSGNWTVKMDARSASYRPNVRVAQMRIVDRSLPIYTYEDTGGRDRWTVAERALGKGGARWLPVRKPALYAGEVFQALCAGQGITLPETRRLKTAPRGDVRATHQSAPLSDIVTGMLKFSTNLTAEMLGISASLTRGEEVTTLQSSANAMNRWAQARLGVPSIALVDHSGLGDRSRMTARDMVAALLAIRGRVPLKPLLKPVPARKGATYAARAKTGTLNFVSGLAGFLDAPDGTELAFAIFAADVPRRSALQRAERERPRGAKGWNTRAKQMQWDLLDRWSALYGT